MKVRAETWLFGCKATRTQAQSSTDRTNRTNRTNHTGRVIDAVARSGFRGALQITLALAGVTFAGPGCGGSGQTRELVSARRAYDEARNGPASKLAPDQLLKAQQALGAAEKAHHADPGSAEEAHLAYLAERKAELATVMGRIAAAKADAVHARRAYVESLEKDAKRERGARENAEQEREAAEERAAAAMQGLSEVAQVRQDDRGTVLTLSASVLFEQGKSKLSQSALESLDRVAQALEQQSPDGKIRIEGYTDSRGSDALNDRLSQQRAESVRDYLVEKGLDADELEAIGRGKADPIASNDTSEGRASNRRVEIVVPAPSHAAADARSDASGGVASSSPR